MLIYRTTLFALGLITATTGVIFVAIYCSLLNYGFTLGELIAYLFTSKAFYLLPLGILLMALSLFASKMWNKLDKFIKDRRHRGHALKSR